MLVLFLGVVALAAAVLVCVNAETVGRRLAVIDRPDNHRKTHAKETPLVGGLAILLALLIWLIGVLASGVSEDATALAVLVLGAAGVGLVGFADDQTPITPLSRILSLCVYLGVAFAVDPSLIAGSLNWGSFEPTPIAPWVYCGLLALTTVGIVNAVNMADGQNGLVPSMFVVWSLSLVLAGDAVVSQVALLIACAGLVVLIFNLRGRLFLGDCGSYGVTFVLGLLAMMAYAKGRISIETITVWFFIPVMDCLRLIITRRLQGRSPMAPDKDHFHHRLQAKLGPTYGLVAYITSVASSSLIATVAPRFALVCLIVLTAIYFSFAWLTDSPAIKAEAGEEEDLLTQDVEEGVTNVVSIAAQERFQGRARH